MRTLKIFAVALALSVFTARTGAAISAPAPIQGERIRLSEPPQWSNSGAWAAQGQSLLLVDVLRDEVRRYDMEGRFVEALDEGYARSKGLEDPTLVQGADDGSVWIEYEDGHLFKLNSQLQLESSLDITGVKGPQGRVTALFWWVPLGNSEVLAFGQIEDGGTVSGAVFRVPVADPANFRILEKMATDSPAHRFFLTGQSFLASVKGKPYYMIMDEIPYLARPDGGRLIPVRLTKEGRQPLKRPELPKRVTMDNTSELFQKLEQTAAPSGIYGWKDSLYVLMRTPGERTTIWTLLKINPSTNQVVWNRVINTSANHLVVIPGEKHWAFVEKGPVKGPGNQKVLSILRVPAQVFAE